MDTTVSVKFQERAFKILLTLEGNQTCADCPSPSPDWASVTLGVFVCHKCSGVHRSIGVHVSRIKSTKLDSWTLKHMFIMAFANNQEANSHWEVNLPNNRSRPDQDTSTEDLTTFIYDKYVHKKFVNPDTKPPIEGVLAKLSLGSDQAEYEDKEQYFNRKLSELDELLQAKVIVNAGAEIEPFGSPMKNNNEGSPFVGFAKNTGQLDKFKALKPQKKPRLASNPETIVNKFPSITKDQKERESDSPKTGSLALFEGLNLKATSSSPKPKDTRDSPEPKSPRKKKNQLSLTSNLQAIPAALPSGGSSGSKGGKHGYTKSMVPMKTHQKETQDSEEDQNERKKRESEEESANKGQELQEVNKASPSKVPRKGDEPFFLNMSPQDITKHGSHLKRPSSEFQQTKVELPSKDKVAPNNLIRPSDAYPAWVVMSGCLLLHLGLGYLFSWGSIAPYIALFFRKDYGIVPYLNVASYSAFILLGMALGFAFPEKLVNQYGFRKTMFACFFCASGMLALCSLGKAPMLYSIIPTLITGFFLGVAYNIPFYCALQYFSDVPANLKSIFYLADGVGSFYFGYSSYKFLGIDEVQLSNPSNSNYPQEIIEDIPILILSFAIKLFIVGTIGSIAAKPKFNFVEKNWLALKDKEEVLLRNRQSSLKTKNKTGHKHEHRDWKNAIFNPAFKALFQITLFSSLLGGYYLYAYKIVGLDLGYSDSYLSLAGGFGMLAMCLGKSAAVMAMKASYFKKYIRKAIIVHVILGFFALLVHDVFLLYFIPIMFMGGFLEALIKEEVRSAYDEEIECQMLAFTMFGLTLGNFLGFSLVKTGSHWLTHKTLNLLLIFPLIWSFVVERNYAREVRAKNSNEESEMTKLMVY